MMNQLFGVHRNVLERNKAISELNSLCPLTSVFGGKYHLEAITTEAIEKKTERYISLTEHTTAFAPFARRHIPP